ncbi:SpoIID/LytB domain-containing protein [Bacillus rubiinfantis]|uniref:SpoIID/LytB domain-containing protein n=1 Tax=Bacillus rubiinfantis TaxID=1499680 RepID=UPI0006950A45|nr:SpoIID/LytB domain-containing protein [Bacillus rubiinfantis]
MSVKKPVAGILAIFLLFSIVIPGASAELILEPLVRVKLVNYLGNKSAVTVVPTGDYLVKETNIRLTSSKPYTVQYEKDNRVSLKDGNAVLVTAGNLQLVPVAENSILSINNRPYPGSFQFISEQSKYVRPINELYMEDYLKAVVPAEMYASWNKEALKAQAVAARTYALSYTQTTIDDTIRYQVYDTTTMHPNSTAAVDETKGQVLKGYNAEGKWGLTAGVFSASNGGKTESNQNAWGTKQLPYLPIKNDPYDAKTKWSFTIQKRQINDTSKPWNELKEKDQTLTDKLKAWLMTKNEFNGKDLKIIAIPSLTLHTPTSGGRVSKADIKLEVFTKDKIDKDGKYILQKISYPNLAASQVRTWIGGNKMLSYLVTESNVTDDAITVSGLGNGHGVGLSQWGAQNRAKAGQKYDEILDFYYEGTKIESAYKLRPAFVAPTIDSANEQLPNETANSAVPTEQSSVPTPQDIAAPIISSVTIVVDQTKNKLNLSFSINEAAALSIYIKDGNNKKDTILENSPIKAGKVSKEIDISKLANGTYHLGIITIDKSQNRASVLPAFEIKRPLPPKDKTAPKITAKKITVDNKQGKTILSFQTNETAYITIIVKNSNGKTIKTIKQNVNTKSGSIRQEYSIQSLVNGKYYFAITVVDKSKNRASTTASFTVNNPVKLKTGKVTASRLNMRVSASTKAKVVRTLKKNQKVTILTTKGSWYRVKYGTKTGYVVKAYIK